VKAKTNQPGNEEQGLETIASTVERVLDQRNGVFVSPTRIVHRVSLPPDKMPVEGSSNLVTILNREEEEHTNNRGILSSSHG